MDYKAMIERRVDAQGGDIKDWREDEEGRTDEDGPRPIAVLGRFRVIEEPDGGMFEVDDEGELTAEVVGAAKFGNARVAFHFKADGYDGGDEIDPEILEPCE